MSDPFETHIAVPVKGGALHVARAGAPPDAAAVVVLAVHGITASHMAWRAVARELSEDSLVCLLAPDLRGRGRSAGLPGPYGIAAHAADLLAVLDHAGAPQAVLAGHSMGAHVVARLAADHPARAASVLLFDGGLTIPALPGAWDEDLEAAAAPASDRMDVAAASADDYVDRWRSHPAFARAWNDDIEAYVRYDVADDGGSARCVVREEAVMADSFELMLDGTTRTAATRVSAPVRLLRASRGVFDDDHPVISPSALDAFISARPQTRVEHVAGVNHYTLLLGDSPGPARAAAAIREAVLEL
jgi:pimeloyl-ACP methyl ester carboxylesterase